MMARSISIFGATGSVGTSTLDLIRRNRDEWRVDALTANCNVAELAALAREFGAKLAVVADERCLPDLREALAEREYLQKSVGPTGLRALEPLQITTYRDHWHRHVLRRGI